MAICYLILHNQDSAIFHAKHLLLNNPDYNRFPYPDPINLTQILRKIKAVHRLQLDLQFGLNYNNIRPIKNYAGWNQNYLENLSYFQIPIYGVFQILEREKIKIALTAGLHGQFLRSANCNTEISNSNTGETIQSTLDLYDNRNSAFFSATTGFRALFPACIGNFTVEMKYAYGFRNAVNTSNRYKNLDWMIANQNIDSDFAFNPVYFSFGYQIPLVKKVVKKED